MREEQGTRHNLVKFRGELKECVSSNKIKCCTVCEDKVKEGRANV